ncbi:MAG: hypothetical protein RI967_1443, partial [Planctomycetota bacterium]
VVNGYRAWAGVGAALERELRDATELAAGEIDIRNARNAELVEMMARAQEAGMFGRRAESLRFLERIVRDNPEVYAAYLAYEPGADGRDGEGAGAGVPPEALGEGGRFYPYFKRDPAAPGGIRLEPLEEVEEDEGLWYDEPKRRYERGRSREPVITKPYRYLGTDIIENVCAIERDGRFAGIAGLDVSLSDLQERLGEIGERLGAELYLETRGLFVAATTDGAGDGATALRTTPVAASPFADAFARASGAEAQLWSAAGPDGESSVFVATTVPTGGWRLVVRKPASTFGAELASVLAVNVATAFAGVAAIVVLLSAGALAISRRVAAARAVADRIAAGDLDRGAVAVRGVDESAELVRAIVRMRDELATIVGSVRAAASRLATTSAQLAATGRSQDEAARAFGDSTQQIAAAVREIAVTGAELARSVEIVDSGARRSAESAALGHERLGRLVETMARLDAATSEIGARLEVIAEKAVSIGSVVDTMTKVAEQTNLLSVNAAIEAEKAGDAGLGFLVVAREIRRLADQTAIASQDIGRIVRQMGESVGAGVDEMRRFAREMRSGAEGARSVGVDLSSIIGDMRAAAESFSEVKRGITGQSAGVLQIEEGVGRVADGARRTAASVAEFAAVADEMAHAIALLQDAVGRFHLADADEQAEDGNLTCGSN